MQVLQELQGDGTICDIFSVNPRALDVKKCACGGLFNLFQSMCIHESLLTSHIYFSIAKEENRCCLDRTRVSRIAQTRAP